MPIFLILFFSNSRYLKVCLHLKLSVFYAVEPVPPLRLATCAGIELLLLYLFKHLSIPGCLGVSWRCLSFCPLRSSLRLGVRASVRL